MTEEKLQNFFFSLDVFLIKKIADFARTFMSILKNSLD